MNHKVHLVNSTGYFSFTPESLNQCFGLSDKQLIQNLDGFKADVDTQDYYISKQDYQTIAILLLEAGARLRDSFQRNSDQFFDVELYYCVVNIFKDKFQDYEVVSILNNDSLQNVFFTQRTIYQRARGLSNATSKGPPLHTGGGSQGRVASTDRQKKYDSRRFI